MGKIAHKNDVPIIPEWEILSKCFIKRQFKFIIKEHYYEADTYLRNTSIACFQL